MYVLNPKACIIEMKYMAWARICGVWAQRQPKAVVRAASIAWLYSDQAWSDRAASVMDLTSIEPEALAVVGEHPADLLSIESERLERIVIASVAVAAVGRILQPAFHGVFERDGVGQSPLRIGVAHYRDRIRGNGIEFDVHDPGIIDDRVGREILERVARSMHERLGHAARIDVPVVDAAIHDGCDGECRGLYDSRVAMGPQA